jgi:hypothetical protein
MLLTDPLGPQLATTGVILVGGGVIYSLLSNSAYKILPWLGVAFYIFFLIYPPLSMISNVPLLWGDFEKSHEPGAVLILAMIWLIVGIAKISNKRLHFFVNILVSFALVLVEPAAALFLDLYLFIMMIFFLLIRNKNAAMYMLFNGLALGFIILLNLIANYLLIGIPDDNLLLPLWSAINFQKVNEWGILFEVVKLKIGRNYQALNKFPLNMDYIKSIFLFLRMDVWHSLLIISSAFFSLTMLSKKTRNATLAQLDILSLSIFGIFLLTIFLLSLVVGYNNIISYYRFTSFTYAPALCFSMLILISVDHIFFNKIRKLVFFMVVVSLGYYYIHQINYQQLQMILKNGILLQTGQYSLADASRHQDGWNGRGMSWGSIYPAAENIWKILPPKTRIWSMHIHSYCMLPDCYMESFDSFRLSKNSEKIYFGEAIQAKAFLQKENLNYFFISDKLQMEDILPYTTLFAPDHISDYLGIAWTNGSDTLLTWKENASHNISTEWLNHYKETINKSSYQPPAFYDMKKTWQDFAKSSHIKKKEFIGIA